MRSTSSLSAFSSSFFAVAARGAGVWRVICLSALLLVVARGQVQEVYSTHDATPAATQEDEFHERWADSKTPGDGKVGIGRQYTVGTVQVRTTENAVFSGVAAVPVPFGPQGTLGDLGTFSLLGSRRQVVMIQCTSAEPFDPSVPGDFQKIEWQRFYYGASPVADDGQRAGNARAIAVWPALEHANTRIAICGETYDEELPMSSRDFSSAAASAPTGFIAVLNGNGDLLWSHHVFGSDPEQSCAITDVSIRVEDDGREVVTYCGISSHGNPGANTTLTPVLAPSGAASLPAGTWMGIVGRVSRPSGGAVGVEFHTDLGVGDIEQVGLFGLTEVEFDDSVHPPISRFVAVGTLGSPTAGLRFGLAVAFDATGTRTHLDPISGMPVQLPLVQKDFTLWGGSNGTCTLAQDVLLLHDAFATGTGTDTKHMLAIVGTTDDSALFSASSWGAATVAHAGGTDGFLMLATDDPANSQGMLLQGGTFHGGPDNDGFTGVQGWSEYPDQIVAAGFTQRAVTGEPPTGGDLDITVASYYLDSSVAGVPPSEVRLLRDHKIGGTADERPAGMGLINAVTVGLPFPTFGSNTPVDDPAGGGVAVDQRARVNVAGYTDSMDYPAPLAPTGPTSLPAAGGRSRDAATPSDAIRTVFDMLPPKGMNMQGLNQPFGMGRTDLSGDQGITATVATPVFTLPAGMTGGASPSCAVSPFGRLIGQPPAVLPRMLLDYEGDAPTATLDGPTDPQIAGTLIISRPSNLVFTAWQFEVPGGGTTTAPGIVSYPPLIDGVEVFVPEAFVQSTYFFATVGLPGHSVRVDVNFAFPAFPAEPAMTVQVFCWFPTMNVVSAAADCAGLTTEMTASAAMWLPL